MIPTAFALGPLIGLQVQERLRRHRDVVLGCHHRRTRNRALRRRSATRGAERQTFLTLRPVYRLETPNDVRTALAAHENITCRRAPALAFTSKGCLVRSEPTDRRRRALDGANSQGHIVTSPPC